MACHMKAILFLAIAIGRVHGEGEDRSWFNCIPGSAGSIGVTTPRGDVNLLHNSKPVDLFCHLSPYHDYFKKGYTSADLSFIINGQDKDHNIIRMQDVSEIVNKTTIKTMFDPLQVGHFNVRCQLTIRKMDAIENKYENKIKDLYNEEKDALMEIAVCPQRVHVGYPPLDVKNFSCLSDNWENLNCTWEEPYNPIRTVYRLEFKEPGRHSHSPCCFYTMAKNSRTKSCISQYDQIRANLRVLRNDFFIFNPLNVLNTENNGNTCFDFVPGNEDKLDYTEKKMIDTCCNNFYGIGLSKTLPEIILIGSNGISLDRMNEKIFPQSIQYVADIVKPGPAQNLRMEGLLSNGLTFSYEIPRQMRHFPPGLIQHIQFRNQWSDEWTVVDTSAWNLENNSFSYNLENLAYAWTNYTIQVKMLSGKSNISDTTYWSKVAEITGSTLAKSPQFAPRTCSGSFEVITGQTERTVIVYWQKLEKKYYNGRSFEYVITDVLEGERLLPIQPYNQMSAYAEFNRVTFENYTIFVKSKNEIGLAPNSSKIFVAQKDKLEAIQPKYITKIYLEENNTVEVSWFLPKHKSIIKSYTVFWCKFPKDRPYQCDGKLDWVDVEPYSKNQPMTHKILLPDSENYQFAVAANTENYSSGMVWSACTIIENRVLSKVKDVTVDDTGEDFVFVRWHSDCSDQGQLVVGYQIEYCPLKTESDKITVDNTFCKTQNVAAADGEQTKILNLLPWTRYKIGVRALTRREPGELSDPVIARTHPSLPGSEPCNIQISLKNEIATVQWTPPAIPNGQVDFYKYKYWTKNKKSGVVTSTYSNTTPETTVELPNLLASTEYIFEIRACNLLNSKGDGCSKFHSNATFITKRWKMGEPAGISNSAVPERSGIKGWILLLISYMFMGHYKIEPWN